VAGPESRPGRRRLEVIRAPQVVGGGGGGAEGPPGPTGPPGATGPAGPGVPVGGATNTLLQKNSATNFDTSWTNSPHVSNIYVAGAIVPGSAPAGGGQNRSIAGDDYGYGPVLVFTGGYSNTSASTGGFAWEGGGGQEVMALTGALRNTASLQIRPSGSGAPGVEALEVNGGMIVGAATAAGNGTIQFAGGHFQGYNGSAWAHGTGRPARSYRGDGIARPNGRDRATGTNRDDGRDGGAGADRSDGCDRRNGPAR